MPGKTLLLIEPEKIGSIIQKNYFLTKKRIKNFEKS